MKPALALLCATLVALAAGPQPARAQFSFLSWPDAGNGPSDDRQQAIEPIISPGTVGLLKPRWVFTASGEVQGTPTVDGPGNAVYFDDNAGSVWRVNITTGQPVWQASMPSITGLAGSYARVSPAVSANAVIIGDQQTATVAALAKSNGAVLWKTVIATDPGAMITSSPIAVGNTVYVAVSSHQELLADIQPGFTLTFRGSVAALDATTGRVLWQSYTVPQGFTGGAVWSSGIAVDQTRNAVYVTTGNNYSVPAPVAACQQAAGSDPVKLDACLPADDHIDSILSLNAATGAVNWGQRFTHADTYTLSCNSIVPQPAIPCPSPSGLDEDFGSGPNLFQIVRNGQLTSVVGAGQKSGAYFTLNRDTGAILWGTQVGPDGLRGGIMWGTATDGLRVYVPNADSNYVKTTLVPSGQQVMGGFWSALDPSSGKILWQTPTTAPAPTALFGGPPPAGATAQAQGAVSVVNGVMFGADAAGNFEALNAATGGVLWRFSSGGASIAAPAVVNGVVYWPSGYGPLGPTNNKVYAFTVGGQ